MVRVPDFLSGRVDRHEPSSAMPRVPWNEYYIWLLPLHRPMENPMRILITILSLALCAESVSAQTPPKEESSEASQHSTGRTVLSPKTNTKTPQGDTGPQETGTGGAPAESPQGETPPAMQPAPDGSSKTIVAPK
jgi:hypothetical protein